MYILRKIFEHQDQLDKRAAKPIFRKYVFSKLVYMFLSF
jgi:hypothetical protein